jgi:hypothetical protein
MEEALFLSGGEGGRRPRAARAADAVECGAAAEPCKGECRGRRSGAGSERTAGRGGDHDEKREGPCDAKHRRKAKGVETRSLVSTGGCFTFSTENLHGRARRQFCIHTRTQCVTHCPRTPTGTPNRQHSRIAPHKPTIHTAAPFFSHLILGPFFRCLTQTIRLCNGRVTVYNGL